MCIFTRTISFFIIFSSLLYQLSSSLLMQLTLNLKLNFRLNRLNKLVSILMYLLFHQKCLFTHKILLSFFYPLLLLLGQIFLFIFLHIHYHLFRMFLHLLSIFKLFYLFFYFLSFLIFLYWFLYTRYLFLLPVDFNFFFLFFFFFPLFYFFFHTLAGWCRHVTNCLFTLEPKNITVFIEINLLI